MVPGQSCLKGLLGQSVDDVWVSCCGAPTLEGAKGADESLMQALVDLTQNLHASYLLEPFAEVVVAPC